MSYSDDYEKEELRNSEGYERGYSDGYQAGYQAAMETINSFGVRVNKNLIDLDEDERER